MRYKVNPEKYAAMKVRGCSNREIARRLGVSESTVRRALAKMKKGLLVPTLPKRRVTVIVIEETI